MTNKLIQRLEQTNASLINCVIFWIGVVVLFAAFIIPESNCINAESNCINIMLSVGCSLIASSIVSYLTSKYLIRANKMKKVLDYWGLESIFATRQEMNRSSDVAFESLEKNLDVIAWGLKSFRDAKDKAIKEKVSRGLKMRFIAPDPDSEYVKQRERDEKEIPGQIANTINNLQEWVEELQDIAPDPKNIQLKYYKSLPEDFYFRVDDRVFIGPYMYGKSSQQTISYEFKGPSNGALHYTDYFESLWTTMSGLAKRGGPSPPHTGHCNRPTNNKS